MDGLIVRKKMEEIGKQQRRIGKLERKWKCMDLDE
jgi:hypothetical protein